VGGGGSFAATGKDRRQVGLVLRFLLISMKKKEPGNDFTVFFLGTRTGKLSEAKKLQSTQNT